MKKLLSVFLSLLITILTVPVSALTDEEWYQLRAERDEFYLEEWGATEERFWILEFGPGRMEKWGDYEVWVQDEGALLLRYYGADKNLVIPEGVTSFSDGIPFWDDKKDEFVTITFPEGFTNLGYETMYGMQKLQKVYLPEGIKYIGTVLYGCPSLEEINIPSTVTWIGSRAFSGCSSLKEIKLPEGLRRIGENAFNGSGLTEITIPASVEVVERSFHNCKKLKKIVITSPDTVLKGWSKDSIGNATLYVPKGSNAEKTAKKLGIRYVVTGQKTYTVKRGDTLWGISRKYLGAGIRYKEIMELNGLKSTLIHAGKKLYLPEK